jgi:pimeloyl-ACP methyl ester carboxylesterase
MNMHTRQALPAQREPIFAFHCSGYDGQQWQKLAQHLGTDFLVHGVNLFGTQVTGHWTGERPFTLADEAKPTFAAIDALAAPVHLVGHSYGGALALYVAVRRIGRVASLTLYEPSAFHLLRQMGSNGRAALEEITALAGVAGNGIVTGDYVRAAAVFVDYWNGPGAWVAMKPEVRASVLAWFAKAPLDFQAALGDQTPLAAYRRLNCPVMIMRGEHALTPSRIISEKLASLVLRSRVVVVPSAGHMGPLTHAGQVNAVMAMHLASACATTHGTVRAA